MSYYCLPRKNQAVFYTTTDDPPQVLPALIFRVNVADTCDLAVLYPDESIPRRVLNVPHGTHPHGWFWPPATAREENIA